MKYLRLLLSFSLVALLSTPAGAGYDIQQGIHGMKWGSEISQHTDLVKVYESGQAAYYVNSTMYYQSANQMVPAVFYGFYNSRLFALFIKLRSPAQFVDLEKQFMERHGKAKTTYNQATGLTVHRWQDQDIKIKLKMRKSPVEYKMAIYYAPISNRLNEEQLENIPSGVYNKAPAGKESTSKPVPLLGN
jgi:hypothetical protein